VATKSTASTRREGERLDVSYELTNRDKSEGVRAWARIESPKTFVVRSGDDELTMVRDHVGLRRNGQLVARGRGSAHLPRLLLHAAMLVPRRPGRDRTVRLDRFDPEFDLFEHAEDHRRFLVVTDRSVTSDEIGLDWSDFAPDRSLGIGYVSETRPGSGQFVASHELEGASLGVELLGPGDESLAEALDWARSVAVRVRLVMHEGDREVAYSAGEQRIPAFPPFESPG
jgi:hypothetical protein